MLLPKNTQYNRQLNLIDKEGKMLTQKNGFVYFYFELKPGEKSYFKCDENLFKNQFDIEADETEGASMTADELEAILKYCKKYPF